MPTWRELKDTILTHAAQPSGGSIEDAINVMGNAVYRDVLDAGHVAHEEREFTFTTVAAKKQYGMPLYAKEVKSIVDPDNDKQLWTEISQGFDESYPGNTSSGTPNLAFALGDRGVQAMPNSDGTLTLTSDAAGDAGSHYKVQVTGYDTAGVLVTEAVTMSGTSNATTSNSYDSTLGIERVTKTPASGVTFQGNVTVKDDDANTISVIPYWWESPDYKWFQLHPIPDAVITYEIRCEMRKPPLLLDNDWPEFNSDFHDLIVWGVTKDLLPTLGKSSVSDKHRLTYRERLRRFTRTETPAGEATWVFADVQSQVGIQQRPHRPLIPGVDTGLGAAT